MATDIKTEALALCADLDVLAAKLADLADKTDPKDGDSVLDGDALASAAVMVTRARQCILTVAGLR